MSHSVVALNPAIKVVSTAVNSSRDENHHEVDIKLKNRIKRKTPAVTRVDECTKADTGVGAAMAAGSHLENGTWGLLVIAAIVIAKICQFFALEVHMCRIFQCPWFKVHAIAKRSTPSPMRLVKALIIPAARDLGFW